jgi:DAACS family dicarboxylate/amino acid:cation (Na+ or H+) symporter
MLIKKIFKAWFYLHSWKKIVCGLILGIAVGLIFGKKAESLEPIGTMFIHAIQMLVVPVVSTAIICAVISLQDLSRMGKMVGKALVLYFIGMAVAASIGIFVANMMGVGEGLSFAQHLVTTTVAARPFVLSEALVNFIPLSPVAAFASNNVMQILCFSVLFGVALKLTGEEGKPVQDFFKSLAKVVFKFAKIIIEFAPYGIFALIATVFGRYGLAVLLPLLKFISCVYLSCFLLIILFYAGVLFLNRISPIWFFNHAISPFITAFTTSSSAATLPVTMRCAHKGLKIDANAANFLLPLGTTLNLNGLAIYLSVATVFAAHLFHVQLDFAHYISLVITIVFTAAGAAAVPGSALIVMSAVMTAMGIPLGALPLIAGIDRFNDMAQTATNVTGDLFATILVAKSEGMLDQHEESRVALFEKE